MTTATARQTRLIWARRISAVVSITLLGRLIGFLYPVLVLRQLDSHAAGLAFFFINTGYFVVQPVSGGPAMAMVRPIAAASSDSERAQWLRAAGAILVPGVAFASTIALIVCVTSEAPAIPMLLMVVGLTADTMYFQLLTARSRYTAAAIYRLISNIAQLAALILIFSLGFHSVTLIVGIFALSYAFGFAVTEPHQRALIGLLKHSVSATRSQRHKLLATATPTLMTGLAYAGITGLDTYLVRLAHSDLVAGYGAAKTLASPFLLVSLAVTTIVQPETARADLNSAIALRRHLLLFGTGIGVVAIAACWILSGFAVSIVYGSRYPEAAMTLSWLGTGATLLGLHTLLQVWCWGRDRYIVPLISLSTGALIAITCNLLLVPGLGARGAGIAFCAGTAVATMLLIILSRPAMVSQRHLVAAPTTDPA
jgi:O-antigen/teichoic acid export membrane protein